MLFPTLANTVEFTRLVGALCKLRPESLVLRRFSVIRFNKHPVVLAANFFQTVADCIEKVFISIEYRAAQIKLDYRLRAIDSLNLAGKVDAL